MEEIIKALAQKAKDDGQLHLAAILYTVTSASMMGMLLELWEHLDGFHEGMQEIFILRQQR